jgi:hypothetical protein
LALQFKKHCLGAEIERDADVLSVSHDGRHDVLALPDLARGGCRLGRNAREPHDFNACPALECVTGLLNVLAGRSRKPYVFNA